jgi:hypothetical protein
MRNGRQGEKVFGGAPNKVGRATLPLLLFGTPFRPNLLRHTLIFQNNNFPKI